MRLMFTSTNKIRRPKPRNRKTMRIVTKAACRRVTLITSRSVIFMVSFNARTSWVMIALKA